MKTVVERIVCPACGKAQDAECVQAIPWWVYVHECSCGYVITESDWEVEKP